MLNKFHPPDQEGIPYHDICLRCRQQDVYISSKDVLSQEIFEFRVLCLMNYLNYIIQEM